jgi:hypothetical protein
MTHSIHYFNHKKQQIYNLKSKRSFIWFLNRNTVKYLVNKMFSLFDGLRLLLLSLGVLAFLL